MPAKKKYPDEIPRTKNVRRKNAGQKTVWHPESSKCDKNGEHATLVHVLYGNCVQSRVEEDGDWAISDEAFMKNMGRLGIKAEKNRGPLQMFMHNPSCVRLHPSQTPLLFFLIKL